MQYWIYFLCGENAFSISMEIYFEFAKNTMKIKKKNIKTNELAVLWRVNKPPV